MNSCSIDKLRRAFVVSLGATSFLLTVGGCHSAFVNATVLNHTGEQLRLIEVDYPSASFGSSDLANGASYKYRFKVLGSGLATLQWTDLHEKEHTSQGPALEEGQQGDLVIDIQGDKAVWSPSLRH